MWQGQDGGVAVTTDGKNWEYINNFAIGQYYQIFADNAVPFYNLIGGLQDNGTWVGPSQTREPAGILNDDWRMISFGDGFYGISHVDNPDLFLTESQGGNVVRTDMKNREQQLVVPYFGVLIYFLEKLNEKSKTENDSRRVSDFSLSVFKYCFRDGANNFRR
jgi:hypothetical protein